MKRSLAEYFSVEGRVGVITGAGGGLCGEMARSLAALGARIAVLDLNADNARQCEEESASPEARPRPIPAACWTGANWHEVEATVGRRWGVPASW